VKKILLLSFITMAILISGCSKNSAVIRQGSSAGDELFNKGKEFYEAEEWKKAIKTLNEFTLSYPFHENIAEGSFLLAESYFNNEDYQLAAGEYRRLIRRFSESEYAEKAELMLAESFLASAPHIALEQNDVERALELFRDFITYRPKSKFIDQARDGIQRCRERLAEKEYRTIELYYKLDKPESVILYADLLAEEYDGTSWVPSAMLTKGKALYYQLEQMDRASKTFTAIIENFPDTDEAVSAAEYLEKIEG